jgi:hypothetical protein
VYPWGNSSPTSEVGPFAPLGTRMSRGNRDNPNSVAKSKELDKPLREYEDYLPLSGCQNMFGVAPELLYRDDAATYADERDASEGNFPPFSSLHRNRAYACAGYSDTVAADKHYLKSRRVVGMTRAGCGPALRLIF